MTSNGVDAIFHQQESSLFFLTPSIRRGKGDGKKEGVRQLGVSSKNGLTLKRFYGTIGQAFSIKFGKLIT